MEFSEAHSPDGHFLAWTPGKVPFQGSEDMSWRLDRGTDLVLQLHMLPSGKPEPLQASVGLYFSATPPTRAALMLRLGSKTMDIPVGRSEEHTSELQSRRNLVCRLLLEKKKEKK